jgi:hypothetical protein
MTWAIWRQNKFIGIGLVLMTMTYLALQCVIANKTALSFSCEFLELMLFTPLNAPRHLVQLFPLHTQDSEGVLPHMLSTSHGQILLQLL